METFTPKKRVVNISKLEKERFQCLIVNIRTYYLVKKTDNTSNIKKNKTIHAECIAGGDQTLRQLKAIFDNMKRNARKDASKERQLRIKTGGGPPAPHAQQETEWFRAMMPISIDGLPSIVDDDFIEIQPVSSHSPEILSISTDCQEVIHLNQSVGVSNAHPDENKGNTNSNENLRLHTVYNVSNFNINDNVFDTKSPASLLRTPVSKPLRIRKWSCSDSKKIYELKLETFKKVREQDEYIHQFKIKHGGKKKGGKGNL